MKPPKLDRGTFAIVGAVSAYVGLQIFAAGVEWERDRAQKLEERRAQDVLDHLATETGHPATVRFDDGRCENVLDGQWRCQLTAGHEGSHDRLSYPAPVP